eukprot:5001788-Prymnesium_polylepis.1
MQSSGGARWPAPGDGLPEHRGRSCSALTSVTTTSRGSGLVFCSVASSDDSKANALLIRSRRACPSHPGLAQAPPCGVSAPQRSQTVKNTALVATRRADCANALETDLSRRSHKNVSSSSTACIITWSSTLASSAM